MLWKIPITVTPWYDHTAQLVWPIDSNRKAFSSPRSEPNRFEKFSFQAYRIYCETTLGNQKVDQRNLFELFKTSLEFNTDLQIWEFFFSRSFNELWNSLLYISGFQSNSRTEFSWKIIRKNPHFYGCVRFWFYIINAAAKKTRHNKNTICRHKRKLSAIFTQSNSLRLFFEKEIQVSFKFNCLQFSFAY